MSKRTKESEPGDGPLKSGGRPDAMDVDTKPVDMGDFEDEFEDEFESEDEIFEAGVDGRPDAEREAEAAGAMDVDNGPGTFIVGRTALAPGDTLTPDPTTYQMLHNLTTPWPCLSFDVVRDSLGDDRKVFPATMYMVAGTQADRGRTSENAVLVMKLSGLSRMERGESSDDDEAEEDDDDETAEPILESRSIPLTSTTNRIRAHQVPAQDASRPPTTLTATMTESSSVFIHNVTPHLAAFDTPGMVLAAAQDKPVGTIGAHKAEGYGIDWSPLHAAGKLLTGDNDGVIYATTGSDGGVFATDPVGFRGHAGSVEDIQWSPSEASVFASASSDGTVRVWDVRSKARKPALTVHVSDTDVNVLSWSRRTTHLLASGADDGEWAVWDLRQWKPGGDGINKSKAKGPRATPVASFAYHKEQITSVEWHPTDDSIVAVAAGDDTVTLWDLAVELDDEESKDTAGVPGVPPQLLFVHYQKTAKELHWHPQIQGALVATGEEFSVFRTISV